MYLVQKIEELVLNYNDSKKSIGRFLLNNSERITDLTMEQIAESTFTSKPSLVRFAKKLGFSGWKEFILVFQEEQRNEQKYLGEVNPNIPFDDTDGYKQIAEKLKVVQQESLDDTFNLFGLSTLTRTVNLLSNSETIMIFCISPYIYLADLFRRKMLTLGKNVIIANPLEASLAAQTLTENDCAIMISYSGNNETLEPLIHMKELKDRSVPFIGVTSGGDNALRKNADFSLTISSRERIYSKIANFATEESINYIFNTIFSCLFSLNYEGNLSNKIDQSIKIESEKRYTDYIKIQG